MGVGQASLKGRIAGGLRNTAEVVIPDDGRSHRNIGTGRPSDSQQGAGQ